MGIFDRLGDVIKSYLTDEDVRIFPDSSRHASFEDPDLQSAYDELNDFLAGKEKKKNGDFGYTRTEYSRTEYSKTGNGGKRYSRTEYSHTEYSGDRKNSGGKTGNPGGRVPAQAPESLRRDFAELGLPLGAGEIECKAAFFMFPGCPA